MRTFLDLSLWHGMIITSLVISIPGLTVFFLVRKFIQKHLNKEHEKVGRLMFRVSASLLALLISLSYANEKINYSKVTDSIEEEASLIATTMLKLRIHNSKTAEKVREGLMQYVKFTIEDRGVDADNPYLTKVMGTMERVNILARALSTDTENQALLKVDIIRDIDMITKTMQIRFYTNRFHVPYLIYILGIGLLITWTFYSVYGFDRISASFITLYNIFLAVLLYFIIMLGNPMVGPLKLDPEPFLILQKRNNSGIPF
jgi:hypothetical protein